MRAFHEIREYPNGLHVWHEVMSNIGISAHWHNELEFIYVKRGNCFMNINSERIPAQEGDLLICDSGDIHFCSEHSNDIVFEFLLFDPELLKFHIKSHPFVSHIRDGESMKKNGLLTEWETVVWRVDRELAEERDYYKEYIRSSLTSFWCYLLRYSELQLEETGEEYKRNRIVRQFRRVLTFIDEHYREDLTLQQIADQAGFSVSYTSRFFRKLTGNGFLEYLNMIRISHAAEMLRDSERLVIDIAFDCGFNNIRSFNRTFIKYVGMTPSEFRERGMEAGQLFQSSRSFSEFTTVAGRNPTVISAALDEDRI